MPAGPHRKLILFGGSFNPKRLPGIQRIYYSPWLTGLANNDPVASYTDFSSNANHATAAGAVRPTYISNAYNGIPGIDFNGTANYLDYNASFFVNSQHTIYLAVAFDVAATDLFIIGGSDTTTNTNLSVRARFSTNALRYGYFGNDMAFSPFANPATTTPQIYAFRQSGSGRAIFDKTGAVIASDGNATLTTAYTTPRIGNYTAGANLFFKGKMFAYFAANQAHDNLTISKTLTWLRSQLQV